MSRPMNRLCGHYQVNGIVLCLSVQQLCVITVCSYQDDGLCHGGVSAETGSTWKSEYNAITWVNLQLPAFTTFSISKTSLPRVA